MPTNPFFNRKQWNILRNCPKDIKVWAFGCSLTTNTTFQQKKIISKGMVSFFVAIASRIEAKPLVVYISWLWNISTVISKPWKSRHYHCMKRALIQIYSGTYFPAFGLNMDKYSISLYIRSECGKIRTWITPNTDTFHVVYITS